MSPIELEKFIVESFKSRFDDIAQEEYTKAEARIKKRFDVSVKTRINQIAECIEVNKFKNKFIINISTEKLKKI